MAESFFYFFLFLIFTLFTEQGCNNKQNKSESQIERTIISKIDSIRLIAKNHPEIARFKLDTIITNVENETWVLSDSIIGELYLTRGNILSEQYALREAQNSYHKAVFYFNKSRSNKKLSSAFMNLGLNFTYLNEYDSALIYYTWTKDIKTKIKDSLGLQRLTNNFAILYSWQGKYDKALENFFEGLDYAKSMFDSSLIAHYLHNIASAYSILGDYDKSIDYYLKSSEIDEKLEDYQSLAETNYNLGIAFLELNDTKNALKRFEKAYIMAEKTKNKNIAYHSLISIGTICILSKKIKEAEDYLEMAFNYIEDTTDYVKHVEHCLIYADLLNEQGRFSEAQKNLNKCLKYQLSKISPLLLAKLYYSLYRSYQSSGNYKKALESYKNYTELNDSLKITESKKLAEELEVKYRTKQKEQENKVLQIEKERKQHTIFALYFASFIFVATGIILFVLYRKNRYLARVNEQNNTELRRINQELSNSLEMRNRFYAMFSHELKNTIGSFKNISQLILDRLGNIQPERLKLFIQELNKSALDAYFMLDNLLLWSISQIYRFDLRKEPVDLKTIIYDAISPFEFEIEKKNLQIKTLFEPATIINIDRRLFNAVLRNLVSNALKFSPNNSTLEIGSEERLIDKQKFIEIFVKDQGSGLTEKEINFIKNSEIVSSRQGTMGETGSGIGLKLVFKLVESHNGFVELESLKGSYTKVSIFIPDEINGY